MRRFVKLFCIGFSALISFGAGASNLNSIDINNGTMSARGGFSIKKKSNEIPPVKFNLIPSGSVFAFEGTCPEGSKPLDYAGRTIVGEGFLSDGTLSHTYRVGERGGKQRHRLSVYELPSHNHTIPTEPDGSGGWGSVRTGPHRPVGKWDSSYSGGTRFHENRMPYLVLNWCLFD